jgi:hypothetical protein
LETNRRIAKTTLRRVPHSSSRAPPQPPLSYPGATPDADRAKRPPLAQPSATNEELSPGDRVEGFGQCTGGTFIVTRYNTTFEYGSAVETFTWVKANGEEAPPLPLMPRDHLHLYADARSASIMGRLCNRGADAGDAPARLGYLREDFKGFTWAATSFVICHVRRSCLNRPSLPFAGRHVVSFSSSSNRSPHIDAKTEVCNFAQSRHGGAG